MKVAEYFCTGDHSTKEWRHYALNLDHYTHFTSPIRRYVDVIVHRLLSLAIEAHNATVASIGNEPFANKDPYTKVSCFANFFLL